MNKNEIHDLVMRLEEIRDEEGKIMTALKDGTTMFDKNIRDRLVALAEIRKKVFESANLFTIK